MRLAIIGLILMGVVAAVATAILLVALKMPAKADSPAEQGPKMVEIVVAARDISQRETLYSDAVELESVAEELMPANAVLSTTQAIGKQVAVSMVKGQALSSVHLTEQQPIEGSISPPFVAASVPITATTGIEKLLYPNCSVNIIAVLQLPSLSENGKTDPVSGTLLTNVRVLAIGDNTVVTTRKENEPPPPPSKMLTFEVLQSEAEVLALAVKIGELTVTLRSSKQQDDEVVSDGTRVGDLAGKLLGRAQQAMDMALETEDRISRLEELIIEMKEDNADLLAAAAAAPAPAEAEPASPGEKHETIIITKSGQTKNVFDKEEKGTLAEEQGDSDADADQEEGGVIARDDETSSRGSN